MHPAAVQLVHVAMSTSQYLMFKQGLDPAKTLRRAAELINQSGASASVCSYLAEAVQLIDCTAVAVSSNWVCLLPE